jgi:hypothetical protein
VAAIAVGNTVSDRLSYRASGTTIIDKNVAADGTGTINTVNIWAVDTYDLVECEVALFYIVLGANYSTRSNVSIGAVTSGSAQPFTGLTLAVTSGDYIGIYFSDGRIERTNSGSFYTKSGDVIPCTDQTFTTGTGTISLNGTGTTTVTGWANIKNIRAGTGSITATDLASIWFGTTEVAVADIAEIPVGLPV